MAALWARTSWRVLLDGWRERMRVVGDGASYVHLIVNEGPLAGASLEHTHAQLYGLRFVPAEIARERERSTAYHQRTMGSHLLGDVATEEVRRRERLVAIDDEAILICPWASRSPFELRIVPRRPAPSFEAEGQGGAAMLGTALRALAGVFGALPQFNLWIRTAPRGSRGVLLAHRHPPAPDDPRRLRARHRRRHQHLRARACGVGPARGAQLGLSAQ